MTSSPTEGFSLKKVFDIIQPFWIGGLSGILATCVIQPVDMIKIQIQLRSQDIGKSGDIKQKNNIFTATKDIFAKSGIRGFYKGIDSAIARQIFYTTSRLGIYRHVSQTIDKANKQKGQKTLSFGQKAFCGSVAGFLGAFIANPADLSLVRMQADVRLPANQKRNYKNVFDAIGRIYRQQGVRGLWRGTVPSLARGTVLNLAMLASYDQVKEKVMAFQKIQKQTMQIRLVASMISGFLTSFVSLPFDNAKVKLQKMKPLPDGSLPYKNIVDAMAKTVKNEGFTHLWVGYTVFYFRIAPHVCITLIAQDFITDYVKKLRAKKQ